jgi:hypothetical protein
MFSGKRPNSNWRMLFYIFVLLVVVGAIYQAVFPPPAQPPVPRMPSFLAQSFELKTPFNIKVEPIDGPKDKVGAGLDTDWLSGNKESITVFYRRKSDDDRKEQTKAAVQLAWENIKTQLPADAPQAVEIIVLRRRVSTFAINENPQPPEFEAFVFIRGLVRRDKKSGLFPETVTEWR